MARFISILILLITVCTSTSALSKNIRHYLNSYRINDFPIVKYKHNTYLPFRLIMVESFKRKKRQKSVWSKDLNDATWEPIQYETEWQKRAGLQVVNLRGKFYLMGGRSPVETPRFVNESNLYNDVWLSSNKGRSWRKIVENGSEYGHWPARAYFKAVTKGKYMYVLGGQNFKPLCIVETPFGCAQYVPASEFFNDVWRSKNGKHWQRMTANAPWQGRAGLMVEVKHNRIYVFGGSANDDCAIIDPSTCTTPNTDPNGPPPREYFNDVWSSKDGKNWRLETSQAQWPARAGGATLVKNGAIYLLGGEYGFLPDEQGNLPYLNDVWKSRNGKNWTKVTANAGFTPRPGHQCDVIYFKMVCFGGFGIDVPDVPFLNGNPVDVWTSPNGKKWKMLAAPPWNAVSSNDIKYDFDIVVDKNWWTGKQSIYTFGGDRERFELPPSENFNRVDNDVWRFGY